jgi:hypothetical protein
MNFQNITLMGLDFDLLQLMILIFFFWETTTGNTFFALCFTWLINVFLEKLRLFFGGRNLATKTLIDPRFLG